MAAKMVKRELSDDLANKLKAFHNSVVEDAENVIWEVFPNKASANVLHFQSLIKEVAQSPSHPLNRAQFSRADVSTSVHTPAYEPPSTSTSSKKRKLDNGVVSASGEEAPLQKRYSEWVEGNEKLRDAMEGMKGEFEELIMLVDKVKLWVNMMMPKVEDGDNFGVEIQEQALAELHRAQDSGYNLLDQLKGYHVSRAKLCSKILKYPNLPDYQEALRRHDERTFFSIRQNLYDLRSIYVVLMDIMHKNIQKIRAPRGNNRENMY